MPLSIEQANELLPKAKHGTKANPVHLVYTLIAEPKFGKTTWMSSIPDSLMLAFERGHSFVEAHKINITAWAEPNSQPEEIDGLYHMTFMDALDAICVSDRFEFVFFDTADMAVKMCADYHLKKLGITHPSDWEYGKGHDAAINTPFRRAINRLTSSGRGVGFITHTETKDSRFSSGTKARKECSLPNGVVKIIIPQSDIVLHGKFGARNKVTQRRDRILITEGNDDMLAGNRVQKSARLPARFIVDENDPWAQWVRFFEDPNAAYEAEAEYEKRKNNAVSTETAAADAVPEKAAARAATRPPTKTAKTNPRRTDESDRHDQDPHGQTQV